MFRRGLALLALVACAACSTNDSGPATDAADASSDATSATDGGDSGPIIPASDGGCDGSVPGMSAGSESQCAGKQGQPVPGSTGVAAPGAACTGADECQPFCCICGDGGAFVSSVAVCGCGNVCASAQETCAFYEKTFGLCN